MDEIAEQIPPEAWPLIGIAFNVTVALTLVWMCLSVFIFLRRSASNLTPVQAARKDRGDTPDFLSVDKTARKEALQRADAFEKELDEREEAEARAARKAEKGPWSLAGTAARLVSLFMSVFTLATMIFGSIWQIGRMGALMREYSTVERLATVIANHPIAFTIATLVVVYHVWRFIADRKWSAAA